MFGDGLTENFPQRHQCICSSMQQIPTMVKKKKKKSRPGHTIEKLKNTNDQEKNRFQKREKTQTNKDRSPLMEWQLDL